ncbi:MAG: EAL domain-containing protein [Clostridiales Family XIII bacterium]|jgi:EAL domain-containing protein (putative c-di-GMP-specific phosphodiesterase class I)/GGDEF domain-containing protein|nr:EAL domain-containing protein [Clostridiales Family XIII bacterium]
MSEYETIEKIGSMLDNANAFLYLVDFHTNKILLANDYYARKLGLHPSEMIGRPCYEYVGGEGSGPCEFCPRDMDLDGNHRFDMHPVTNEGYNPMLDMYWRCTAVPVELENGYFAHAITAIDFTNEKMASDELSHLAYYDRAMNLPNRLRLEKDLLARPEGNYCLVAYDFTALRFINDAYGRVVGDALLQMVIKWIRTFEMKNYQIYRVDGDQFCVLLDNADAILASGLVERLWERFTEPWEININDSQTFVTTKISECFIDGRVGEKSPEAIFSVMERTLDLSRESQSIAVYSKEMDAAIRRNLRLEMSLKECVINDMQGFDVHLQPIVTSEQERWIGLEALARWESPEFGRIPPLVFIHIAEQIGLINTIGYWILDRAVEICRELRLDEVEDFFLDVNLSPSQMSDETLVPKVLHVLEKHDFPAHCLALEVTESEEVNFGDYSSLSIERLRSFGIKMALDDFGTGYSNFNNVRNLPVSILKTEKQFIDDIVTDDFQKFLSHVLVQLAHVSGMKLIAEGVETREQMLEIMKNQADYFQGYLFSKPLNSKQLSENIHHFIDVDPIFAPAKEEIKDEVNRLVCPRDDVKICYNIDSFDFGF